MKSKTLVTITSTAVLTALYVALSAMMKIPLIGNISLDLGYIVFAVALVRYRWAGIAVGVIGCALESILFSAYGFSISWCIMNLTIGIICCVVAEILCKAKGLSSKSKGVITLIWVVLAVIIGAFLKGGIECILYSIPFAVKLPKILMAILLDSAMMIVGLVIQATYLSKYKF